MSDYHTSHCENSRARTLRSVGELHNSSLLVVVWAALSRLGLDAVIGSGLAHRKKRGSRSFKRRSSQSGGGQEVEGDS